MESFYINDDGCETYEKTNQKIVIISNPNILINGYKINEYWKKYTELITNNLDEVCKSSINFGNNFENYEIIFLLFNINRKRLRYGKDIENEKLMGFMLTNTKYLSNGEKSLYVDILCSNTKNYNFLLKGGKILLNEALNTALEKKYNYLELSSLPQVLSYYRKLGFSHYDVKLKKENEELNKLGNLNLNLMLNSIDEVNDIILIEKAFKESHIKNDLNEEALKKNLKLYLNLDSLPDDLSLLEYISLIQPHVIQNKGKFGLYDYIISLIKNKYSTDCKDLKSFEESKFLEKDEYSNYNFVCGDNGFIMRKVVSDIPLIKCDVIKGGKKINTYKSNKGTFKKYRKTQKNKNLPWSGWSDEKPKNYERKLMKEKCGSKCFLGPNSSFPICSRNTCKINSKGVYAAYVRAKQWGKSPKKYIGRSKPTYKQYIYEKVARNAKKILRNRGYKNIGNK